MEFCLAKQDITPQHPVFMCGFGVRDHKSEGVHDPIYAKVALLSANQPMLIITLDALGSDHSFSIGLKSMLKEKFSLTPDQVLINFSHTHASIYLTGPDESQRRGGYSMGQTEWPETMEGTNYEEDLRYYYFIIESIELSVRYCFDHLIEGKLLIGSEKVDFAISRRVVTEHGVKWWPNYTAAYDDDLFVLQLIDMNEKVRGILYNYGCHPTSLGADNYKISGDFVGKASALIEASNPDAIAIFLQGCGAELKPLKSANGALFKSCSLTEMEEIGADMADAVTRVISNNAFEHVQCSFKSVLLEPALYMENAPIAQYEHIAANQQTMSYVRYAAKRTLQAIQEQKINDRLPIYIGIWHLDDSTRIIAIEGEVATDYALLFKKLFPTGKTLVLGYTNSVFCYIPTAKILDEGGYEAECNYYFGLKGPFVPETEDIIVGQVIKADLILSQKQQ